MYLYLDGVTVTFDDDLSLSWHHEIETVPTLIRVVDGIEQERTIGWSRAEWQRLTGIADEIEYLPRMAKVRINLLTMVQQYYAELIDLHPHNAETIVERAGAGLSMG